MIEVDIPKDLRKVKPEIVGKLGIRQCVCIVIGAVYEIPFIIYFPFLDIPYRILIGFFLFIPLFFFGWREVSGMPYELYLARVIYTRFLTPRERLYKQHNFIYKKKHIPKTEKKKQTTVSKNTPKEFIPYK